MRALALLLVCAAVAVLPCVQASEPPGIPCQAGIAGTYCGVVAGDCYAGAGIRTSPQEYEYARAGCGLPDGTPCAIDADTRGHVGACGL